MKKWVGGRLLRLEILELLLNGVLGYWIGVSWFKGPFPVVVFYRWKQDIQKVLG